MNPFVEKVLMVLITLVVTALFGTLTIFIKNTFSALRTVRKIAPVLDRISEMNATQLHAQRFIARALRSHSYALREVGANGSVDQALKHINDAEDLLNKQEAKNNENISVRSSGKQA